MNYQKTTYKANIKLISGEYLIGERDDEYVDVNVEGFGMEVKPGKPQLPGYTYHVELPQGAIFRSIQVRGINSIEIDGVFRIEPAHAVIHDRPTGTPKEMAKLIEDAKQLRARNFDAIYSSDELFPEKTVTHIGTWEERKRSFVLLRFNPLQYRPRSGCLLWNKEVDLEIKYSLNDDSDTTTNARNMISLGELFTLPPQLWGKKPVSLVDTTSQKGFFNYVIIVRNKSIIKEVTDFKRWKERIGHSVAIVTLEDVYSRYNGVDDAEKVRNFLIEKFDEWRIHFVLLVGNMEEMPTRLLYANNKTDAYASDFYYANLSTSNWDLDSDDRWGEFGDDQFNYRYDVVVGRLPLQSPAEIKQYFDNVISFEQDTGGWKHSALFAAGFMDHDPTDGAELVEQIKAKILSPAGWSFRTLYEKGGTVPSNYPCDLDLDQTNYVNECSPQQQSLICLTAHGRWDEMISKQCTDPPGKCNPDNDIENRFGEDSGINANFCSAIVYMNGCSTACPVSEYKHVEPQATTPPTTPTRSLFDFKTMHEHNGIRYLRNGAVAGIGSSAGADYTHKWKNPNHGYSWSLAFYFYLQLIYDHKSVGEAFFRGMLMHAVRHNALKRGVRDFYYMGDPSLNLDGVVCDNEARNDVIVHRGNWSYFAADNDKNGDMYVAVSVGLCGRRNDEILVYKSIDHGQSWSKWYSYMEDEQILNIEVLVNRAGVSEFQDDRLLVFYTTITGKIILLRIPLAGSEGQRVAIPIQPGAEKGLFNHLSVTQDNLDAESNIYLAYCFYDKGSKINSVVGISNNNGLSWRNWSKFAGYYYPTIQVGPNNMLYFAAAHDDVEFPIFVRRSDDLGISWGPRTNLTVGDTATSHIPSPCGPSIAVSTNPSYPAVWVSYERSYDEKFGRHTNDIGFAYSLDDGQHWKRNLTLSVGPTYLSECQLKGYMATPNQNINAVYVSKIPGSSSYGKSTVRIVLRAVSGEYPDRWSPAHIVNHNEAVGNRPQLVNSPGAPSTGSGILYGGSNGDILFSAPWI